jgi:hypothetical protein
MRSAANKPVKLPKLTNPIARALRSPALRPKVVPSGKLYSRKGKAPSTPIAD